jgi:Arc/MetJ family transcription regulator
MRTTLNLDEELVRELMQSTSARSKTEAIHMAMKELIRRKKLEKLKALSGKVRIELDMKTREKVETEHQSSLKRRRSGTR